MRRPIARWVPIAALVLATACASGDGSAAGPTTAPGDPPPAVSTPAADPSKTAPTPPNNPSPTDPSQAAPTPTPNSGPLAMSWTEPFEIGLPNGWTVRDCEGDRLNVCVHDGARLLGDIELLTGYPLDDQQRGQDPLTVLRQWAGEFLTAFRDDRAAGCPDFTFTADDVTVVTVGGQAATRAGFTLTDPGGRVVERVVNHYTVRDGTVAIVNADAYVAEGGCLGPSETDPSFTPDDLAGLEPHLDRLLADTPLPARSG